MFILRQSTAVDVLIGPFVDGTDGATTEEGESPSVQLSKNGQTAATKNEGTTPAHDNAGYYNCVFDATDTGTVGTLVAFVEGSPSTFLQVRHEFQIITQDAYDFSYASDAAPDTQVADIPITSEFEARTIVSADYFDPAADTVALVTDLSNLPSIPANWLTATGINAAAFTEPKFGADFLTSAKIADDAFLAINFAANSLDGKGDWNVDKTGYSLTVADWNVGKSGYALTVPPLTAVQVNTEVDNALDTALIEITQGVPDATPSLRDALMLLYMALRNQLDITTSGADFIEVHNDAGTIISKKALTDAGGDYSEAKMITGA